MNSEKIVSAVVVLYNPEDDVIINLRSIALQVDHCIVVDNSIKDNNYINSVNGNIIYSSLKDNYGIATAQNIGLKISKERKSDFVIFFDQDSFVEPKTISKLLKSYKQLKELGYKVGVIGPRAYNKIDGINYVHKDRDQASKIRSIEDKYTPVEYTLSSGSLCNMDVFNTCGGYKDSFFIDSVDHELCWRLISNGYSNFICEDIKMAHMLGENRIKTMFGYVNIPAPIRHYYVFRNWIFLMKLNYVPIKFKIRTLLRFIPKIIYFSLFSGSRKERSKYIFKGVFDGLINKGGKYHE